MADTCNWPSELAIIFLYSKAVNYRMNEKINYLKINYNHFVIYKSVLVILTSPPPTDMIGCRLNIHCPLTEVISGTVCTVVGTCPTVGTDTCPTVGTLTTDGLERVVDGFKGVITVFTVLVTEIDKTKIYNNL